MANSFSNSIKLSAAKFGLKPGTGEDMTVALSIALKACAGQAAVLSFEPGCYDFWPDRAFEKYLFLSNNDEGLKRIIFPLIGMNNLVLDGGGASFVFHGQMIPFLVEKSQSLRIRNLSIDFSRTFHSEGTVVEIHSEHVDLKIDKNFPYEIRNGVLVFTDGSRQTGPATTVQSGEILYPYNSLLAFDPKRRETAFKVQDKFLLDSGVAAQDIGQDKIRIFATNVSANVGDMIVFGAGRRSFPGFVLSESADIYLENVTIHHSGGMGVIAQKCEDISLTNVRVTPGKGRTISTPADATHFTNCRGQIALTDCLFENQMDDAVNIHGIYVQVCRIIDKNSFEVRFAHPQQFGLDFIAENMRLEMTRADSLLPIGELTVKSVTPINKEYSRVTVFESLPPDLRVGDVVSDAAANTATVVIKNCRLRGNRARGILLGSRGRTVIEKNYFHTPGSAILFEGDANHWFEQAGVQDVSISGNTFDNCNFGVWGEAVIEVRSGIAPDARKTSRYNRNIRIENNTFRTFGDNLLVDAYSVDGLTFCKNTVEPTTDYPSPKAPNKHFFRVKDCDHVTLNNPHFF
ncbi:MAG: right-handed parallel beta-helix repeat-containing protein [Chthoniobacterales bacterium]